MIKIEIETKHPDLGIGDIVILISNGKRIYPIKLYWEDYAKWNNRKAIEMTVDLINTGIKLLEETTLKGKIKRSC